MKTKDKYYVRYYSESFGEDRMEGFKYLRSARRFASELLEKGLISSYEIVTHRNRIIALVG